MDSNNNKRRMALMEEKSLNGIVRYIERANASKIITMAGAGISTAAGIPDFRSPKTGFYHSLLQHYKQPEDLFKIENFNKNAAPFFAHVRDLLPGPYKPTISHYFIKMLHEKGLLLRHYTQNIDSLEQMAGIPEEKIVEAHGSFRSSHCRDCQKQYTLDWLKAQLDHNKNQENFVPSCEACGGVVKPDIVFFNEDLPQRFYACSSIDFQQCDLLIILGTSLVVHPFATQVERIPKDVPRLMINRYKSGFSTREVRRLLGYSTPLDFSARSRNVAWEGDCDQGCLEFADALGWTGEFRALLAEKNVPVVKETTPPMENKQETQENHSRPKRMKKIRQFR